VLIEVAQKIHDLQELNKDTRIPALTAAQEEIQEQFDRATELAQRLEGVMAAFSDDRESLQREIHDETEWLNKLKDRLSKCDDVSGADEDLVERLQACKVNSVNY
jgi:nesprin-1